MKSSKYLHRFYRDWLGDDLHLARIIAKETDLEILTNKKIDRAFVEERIRLYRWEVEHYINRDPRFLTALKPLAVELNAPAIIKQMAEAARAANLGPMSAVAGAIAECLGRDLLKQGYKDVIVENGGDIFLKTSKARRIGIYSGRSKLYNSLSLKIKAKDTPVGICTSSGTVSHSLSFGCADSVVILARSATLADAVSAAACNQVQTRQDLEKAVNFARSIPGVAGAVAVLKNSLSSWGKIEFISGK